MQQDTDVKAKESVLESQDTPKSVQQNANSAILKQLRDRREASFALWQDARETRRKVAAIMRKQQSPDPALVEIADLETESFRRRVEINRAIPRQRLMGGGDPGGFRPEFTDLSSAISYYTNFSERTYCAPFARKYAYGAEDHLQNVPGIEAEMLANRQTGELLASYNVFDNGSAHSVSAGFWIDFGLDVPVNPMLARLREDLTVPARLGRARIMLQFLSGAADWSLYAQGMRGASKGLVLIAVFANPGNDPLWHEVTLWDKVADSHDPSNVVAGSDSRGVPSCVSPWFDIDSWSRYSAWVGVSVRVEGDVDPPDRKAMAQGRIDATLGCVTVQQHLLP